MTMPAAPAVERSRPDLFGPFSQRFADHAATGGSGLAQTRPPVILVIDDDASTLELFGWILKSAGIRAWRAATGSEGLAAARQRSHDLILVDLRLPDISGLDVIRQLRREGIRTPFIVITAFANVEAEAEAKQLGALSLISKPLLGDALLDSILSNLPGIKRSTGDE